MKECLLIEFYVLEVFRSWLGQHERNGGKGYAPKTINRYIDAMRNLQMARAYFEIEDNV